MAEREEWNRFQAMLERLGGSADDKRLREALGSNEAVYAQIRDETIKEGVLVPGRNRGGFCLLRWREGLGGVKPRSAEAMTAWTSNEKPARPKNASNGISIARLQSFYDWFVLHVSERQQLKQVGNAVPPLMGLSVARTPEGLLAASRNAGASSRQG